MRFGILGLLLLPALFAMGQKDRQPEKTAQLMQQHGYVDIQKMDPSIFVSLMYAHADNFTGTDLYGDLHEAYLHPLAANALLKAQKRLKKLRPDLSLKVMDAARPMSIQQKMWDKLKRTPFKNYVSNPAHGGGLHNYGLAVDITLCNSKGEEVDMGTRVDYFGAAAHIDHEAQLVRQKRISNRALANRLLLRQVMGYAGFKPLRTEWWHFNLQTRAQARKYFKVIP